MKQIVFLATAWGSKYGGINSFNFDLCKEVAKQLKRRNEYQVVCVVLNADQKAIERAKNDDDIELIPLKINTRTGFVENDIYQIEHILREYSVEWWVGHDVISGEIALKLKEIYTNHSSQVALIHHMDYGEYEILKCNKKDTDEFQKKYEDFQRKYRSQREIFRNANAVFAIGPYLEKSAENISRKRVTPLIPGLREEFGNSKVPHFFRVIALGRLDPDNDVVKQLRLSVKALGHAYNQLKKINRQTKAPNMLIYGISEALDKAKDEVSDLLTMAKEYAHGDFPVNPFPYNENREYVWQEMQTCCTCLMPSFYEGFGLVAWEAIGMEVPIILSRNTGVFHLLDALDFTGSIQHVDISGIEEKDLGPLTQCITEVFSNKQRYKDKIVNLKKRLLNEGYTWENTGKTFLEALNQIQSIRKDPVQDSSEDQTLLDLLDKRSGLDKPYRFKVDDSQPEFQGRQKELKWLSNHFNEVVQSSKSRTLLIQGQKGVGRHRLVHRFAETLLKKPQPPWVVIRTFDDGRFAPENMSAQLAKELWYHSKDLLSPKDRERIKHIIITILGERSSGADGDIQNTSVDTILLELLHELAQKRPLVLILENLHNASLSLGIDFFNKTLSEKGDGALLVIGTIRIESEGVFSNDMRGKIHISEEQSLTLSNLCDLEARKLIYSLCSPPSKSLVDDFYKKIFHSTVGNPYLIVETIEHLKKCEILRESGDGWMYQASAKLPRWTPDFLKNFVEDQLKQLKEQHGHAAEDIQYAAVIGPRFLKRILQKVAGYNKDQIREFQSSLNAMRELGLITVIDEDEDKIVLGSGIATYAFQSQFIQEWLYKNKYDEDVHIAIAKVLEEFYNNETNHIQYRERLRFWCAYHYLLGDDFNRAKDFLLKLVDATSYPFETIWLLTRMLESFKKALTSDEEIQLLQNLAQKYSEVGRLEDAFISYSKVRDRAARSNKLASLALEITAEMAWVRVKQAKFEHAESLAQEALKRLKKAADSASIELSIKVYNVNSGVLLERLTAKNFHEPPQTIIEHALQYIKKANKLLDKLDPSDSEAQRHRVLVLNSFGRFFLEISKTGLYDFSEDFLLDCQKKAELYLKEAEDALKDITESSGLKAYIQNNYGVLAARLRNYPKAKSLYEESLENTHRQENVFLRTKTLLNLAEIYVIEKQYKQAIECAEEGRWYAELLEHRVYQCEACCWLGQSYFSLSNLKKAHYFYAKAQKLDYDNTSIREALTNIDELLELEENNGQ